MKKRDNSSRNFIIGGACLLAVGTALAALGVVFAQGALISLAAPFLGIGTVCLLFSFD